MNSKQQSFIGVAKAIEYYSNLGYSVFVQLHTNTIKEFDISELEDKSSVRLK